MCGIGGFRWPFFVAKLILFAYWFSMWIWRIWDFKTNWHPGILPNDTRKYPDYLTNWNDTQVMIYLTYSVILVVFNLSWSKVHDPAPWYYYISQALYQIAVVNSTLITIVSFTLLPPRFDTGAIHAHIMGGKKTRNNLKLPVFHFIRKTVYLGCLELFHLKNPKSCRHPKYPLYMVTKNPRKIRKWPK